jgi:hypothetical protein
VGEGEDRPAWRAGQRGGGGCGMSGLVGAVAKRSMQPQPQPAFETSSKMECRYSFIPSSMHPPTPPSLQNTHLTSRSPSPNHFDVMELMLTLRKWAPLSQATALASIVFPVPAQHAKHALSTKMSANERLASEHHTERRRCRH